MLKNLKVFGLVAAVAVFMVAASATSKADDIQIGGLVSFSPVANSQCSGSTTGCQAVSFSNLTVLATNPSEPVNSSTSPVSFPTFNLGYWGGATFSPSSGALSITINGQTLTGNIAWDSLVTTGSGGFQLDVSLSGLAGGGTDSILDAFTSHGQGNGILTFQFLAGSGITSDQALADSIAPLPNNSVSATLSTPEPASLGLFGIGLLALAFVYRRRLKALA